MTQCSVSGESGDGQQCVDVCFSFQDASIDDGREHNESQSDGRAGAVGQQELATSIATHHGGPATTLCHPQGAFALSITPLSLCDVLMFRSIVKFVRL